MFDTSSFYCPMTAHVSFLTYIIALYTMPLMSLILWSKWMFLLKEITSVLQKPFIVISLPESKSYIVLMVTLFRGVSYWFKAVQSIRSQIMLQKWPTISMAKMLSSVLYSFHTPISGLSLDSDCVVFLHRNDCQLSCLCSLL